MSNQPQKITYFHHNIVVLGADMHPSIIPAVVYCAPSEVETLKRMARSYLLVDDECDVDQIPEFLNAGFNVAEVVHRVGHQGRRCAICTLEEVLQRGTNTPVTVNSRIKAGAEALFNDLAGSGSTPVVLNVMVASLVSGVSVLDAFLVPVDQAVQVNNVMLVTQASPLQDLVPKFNVREADTDILVSDEITSSPEYLSADSIANSIKRLYPKITRMAVQDTLFMYKDEQS